MEDGLGRGQSKRAAQKAAPMQRNKQMGYVFQMFSCKKVCKALN